VVRDIGSLVFWLGALDPAHADVDGRSAVASAARLNRVLAGNVDERGFVTNEHRYLAIAQGSAQELSPVEASFGPAGKPLEPSFRARIGCLRPCRSEDIGQTA
jgi:hypothetical protein